MAGLLSPESGAALSMLGAGLLQGNFGGGLAAASQYASGLPEQRLRRGLLEQQIAETQAQAEERKARLAAMQRQQEMLSGLFGGAGSPAPAQTGQLGSGSFGIVPTAAGVPDIPKATASRIASMSADQIAALKANGIDLTEVWKTAKQGFERKPGTFYESDGGSREYVGDPTKGFTYQGGQVGLMPGYTNALSQITMAQEGPKALLNSASRVALRPMPDGTQAPVSELSENPVLQRLLGVQAPMQAPTQAPQQGSPQRPVVSPEAQRTADQEAIRMMQVELQNPNLPPDQRAGIQREIARLQQASAQPGFPAASSIRAPGQGYGKTTQQQIEEDAARIRATEQAKADVVPNSQRQQASLSADYLFNTIGKALTHKGRETATGLSGSLDPRNYIPGTDAKNFRVLMDQIQGSAFLKAYESLKGGGAITQIEGEKAERAIARLNTAQSDDEFKSALIEFQDIVKAGRDRLKFGGDLLQLPANPTPQNLQRGKAYPLPGGKVGVWDGMGFKVQ
jgi:hypothetical protein